MLKKEMSVDKIEVASDNSVCVRSVIRVIDGDNLIASNLHRHIIFPGDDYSNEEARVQAICAATHTAEVIDSYKAAMAAKGV